MPQKITPSIARKIDAMLTAEMSFLDIGSKLSLSDRTIRRYAEKRGLSEHKANSIVKAPSDKDIRLAEDNKALEYQRTFAIESVKKALDIVRSIDPDKIPEGQKSMSSGILLDKFRLITGQANSIVRSEHISIQLSGAISRREDAMRSKAKVNEDVVDVECQEVDISPDPDAPKPEQN